MKISNQEILDWVAATDIDDALDSFLSFDEKLVAVSAVYKYRRQLVLYKMRSLLLTARENGYEPHSLVDVSLKKFRVGAAKPQRETGEVRGLVSPIGLMSYDEFMRFGDVYGLRAPQVSRIEHYLKAYDQVNYQLNTGQNQLLFGDEIGPMFPRQQDRYDWNLSLPNLGEALLTDRLSQTEGFGDSTLDLLYVLTEEWLIAQRIETEPIN